MQKMFRHVLILSIGCTVVALLATPIASSAQATPPYAQTVIVSSVPGNPTASGQNLLNAIASINGASQNNRWLLKVEPGVFDVGTTAFQMKAWVDVEGSGRKQTTIRGSGQAFQTDFTIGVVQGANNTEMRQLTVSCLPTEERPDCLTIANFQASPSFLQMNVTTTTAAGSGARWGFRNTQASPQYDQVTITVANGSNNYGIVNSAGSAPTIRRSFIKVVTADGTNDGILDRESGYAALVEDTTIQVRTGGTCHGIRNIGGGGSVPPLVLRRVTMLVDGGTSGNYGVLGQAPQDVRVEHSNITVYGGNGVGLRNQVSGSAITVTHSELVGAQVLVEADTVNIGSTWLRGGGAVTGFVNERCAAVYTNQLTFFPSTCP
jgi:hypothetical protein